MEDLRNVRKVDICDYNAELLRPKFEDFAQKIDRDVVVSTYRRNNCNHKWINYNDFEPRFFGIFFEVLPVDCVETEILSAYGHILEGDQSRGCFPTRQDDFLGSTIYDEDGYAMAVFDENALYILFGVNVNTDDLFQIIDLLFRDYELYRQHPRLFAGEMKRRMEGKNFKHFSELCSVVQREISKKELVAVEEKIDDLVKSLPKLARRVMLASTNNSESETEAKFVSIYEDLGKLDTRGKVYISLEGLLTVSIGQIDIVYDMIVYDIGMFDIVIDIKGGTVQCRNRTRTIRDHHHPSVGISGDLEMGEATYGLMVLLGRLELSLAVKMIMNYLQSFDPETCLMDIKSWPVKEVTSE